MTESTATKFALLKKDIAEIYKDICNFVTKSDFASEIKRLDSRINPIEKIVYGALGLIVTAVLGALIALVVKR